MAQEKGFAGPGGLVFNIQRYSLHDGPGIRTLVFLKGCALRCLWCSNPESQRLEPELAYNEDKCIGTKECAFCRDVCPSGAVKEKDNRIVSIDRTLCDACLQCADACPSLALSVFGKPMTVNEVLEAVEADGDFYGRSGGGMTLSGGEPLVQAGFACELLKEAKRRRINTSIETCGFVEWKDLEQACGYLDSILFDIKSMNPVKHKQFTGVSNEKILENFKRLCERFPALAKRVRTPVIPGFNDTEEDIEAIVDFIRGNPNIEYELLAYHRLGQPKYLYLGREYALVDIRVDDERMKALERVKRVRMGDSPAGSSNGVSDEKEAHDAG